MEKKGQGAIEYLLIIGAAILVVAIVILAVTGALGTGQEANKSGVTQAQIALCKTTCAALGSDCSVAVPGSCNGLAGPNETTCPTDADCCPTAAHCQLPA